MQTKGGNKMKKMILIIITLILSTNVCFANFIDDNPHRFVKMPAMEFDDIYIDTDSIKLIRDDFPFYVIDVDEYWKSYTDYFITKNTSRYFYDYNSQKMYGLLIKWGALYKQDGTNIPIKYKDKNGKIKYKQINESTNSKIVSLPEKSNGYIAANVVFYYVYHKWFSKNFNEKIKERNQKVLGGKDAI